MKLQDFIDALDASDLAKVEQQVIAKISATLVQEAETLKANVELVTQALRPTGNDFDVPFVKIRISNKKLQSLQAAFPRAKRKGGVIGVPLPVKLQQRLARKKKRTKPATILYADTNGNTWSGRGKNPRWMEGRNKEDFRIKELDNVQ